MHCLNCGKETASEGQSLCQNCLDAFETITYESGNVHCQDCRKIIGVKKLPKRGLGSGSHETTGICESCLQKRREQMQSYSLAL